jgi:hypothetical protein
MRAQVNQAYGQELRLAMTNCQELRLARPMVRSSGLLGVWSGAQVSHDQWSGARFSQANSQELRLAMTNCQEFRLARPVVRSSG